MAADWKGVSERIQGLISMSDKAHLASAAARLGVTERELRAALDQQSPSYTLKVVGAVVRVYGLDPSWVLTGKYDSATHRAALQRDAGAIDELLTELLAEPSTRDSSPEKELD